jgi:hypothetical protein
MDVRGGAIAGLEWGNAAHDSADGDHWIVGFSKRLELAPLRHMPSALRASGLSLKFREHPTNDPEGLCKPKSTGRTISILANAGGKFLLRFWRDGGPKTTVLLDTPGDFAAWGEGIDHEWEVPETSTVISLRWRPESSIGEASASVH